MSWREFGDWKHDALAALRRTGRLTVGYFTGVPAGHVTYDLVGHLLRFHTDPRVEIVWFCGGTVNPLEFEKVKRGSQEAGGLKHAAVDGADADVSQLSARTKREPR